MIYPTTDFWELVLNVIGLFFCGITILHLIRNRSKYNQSLLKERGKGNSNSFNEEVLAQLVKQQSDMPFETISDAIEKERMLLHNLIEKKEAIKEEKPLFAEETNWVQEDFYNKKEFGQWRFGR